MGMSYAEIARTINAQFKTHYSRCAAIGRAKRLGLGISRPLDQPDSPLPKASSSDAYKMFKSYEALAKWLARRADRKEIPKLRCIALEPRHLSLIELQAGDCRYPHGGDEEGEAVTFCGHPKRAGSSYCAAHFHLTRNPDALPQRAVVKAARPSRFRRFPLSQFQGSN